MSSRPVPHGSYPQEFIDRAVQMVIEGWRADGHGRRSMVSISTELGVPLTNLHRWVHKAYPDEARRLARPHTVAPHVSAAPTSNGACQSRRVTAQLDDTAAAIRRDNDRLARENAVLKAALSLLARDCVPPTLF